MNKYFATTPIYYVNDTPHIGHTYTTIAADVLVRYYDQKGYDSKLLTGTDEHGAKIVEAAEKHNQSPQEYADKIAAEFKKSWESLNINFVRFIRTTDADHIKVSQDFLQKLYDNGAIDAKPRLYEGLYCVSCEKFWNPEDLTSEGFCPDHLKAPIKHSEENYYFNLSKYQDQLIELINSDTLKVRPDGKKKEILERLKRGLDDISISRANLDWGIPLPFDSSHTSYVWIEALINYYTYGSQNDCWPADLHLVGKDILWFHSVIWPALLLAINEPLPKQVFAHGFFTIDGQKMSKTLGNVIKPADLVSKYGVDGTRYVLLASFPFGEDGNFSWEYFDRLYNADLANGLGNLAARTAKLCERCELEFTDNSNDFSDSDFDTAIQDLNFTGALAVATNYLKQTDIKINEEKPWEIKDNDQLKKVLEFYVIEIIKVSKLLKPFIPETAEKILKQFSGKIKSTEGLFPRI